MKVNYVKKTGAFSLIEIIVAVAIIAILSSLVVPQVRTQIAKSKDTKAVSTLHTFRVATQMFQVEKDENLVASANNISEESTKNALEKLLPYLDNNAKKIVKNNGKIDIGGSRETKDGKIIYGGKVKLSFTNPETKAVDGFNLWLEPIEGTKEYDTKGNKWTSY